MNEEARFAITVTWVVSLAGLVASTGWTAGSGIDLVWTGTWGARA